MGPARQRIVPGSTGSAGSVGSRLPGQHWPSASHTAWLMARGAIAKGHATAHPRSLPIETPAAVPIQGTDRASDSVMRTIEPS